MKSSTLRHSPPETSLPPHVLPPSSSFSLSLLPSSPFHLLSPSLHLSSLLPPRSSTTGLSASSPSSVTDNLRLSFIPPLSLPTPVKMVACEALSPEGTVVNSLPHLSPPTSCGAETESCPLLLVATLSDGAVESPEVSLMTLAARSLAAESSLTFLLLHSPQRVHLSPSPLSQNLVLWSRSSLRLPPTPAPWPRAAPRGRLPPPPQSSSFTTFFPALQPSRAGARACHASAGPPSFHALLGAAHVSA